jgi:hypothetical protein
VRGQLPIVWGVKWSSTKNNKDKIHGGLNWLPIGEPTHNNQLKINGKDRGVIEEKVQPGGRV